MPVKRQATKVKQRLKVVSERLSDAFLRISSTRAWMGSSRNGELRRRVGKNFPCAFELDAIFTSVHYQCHTSSLLIQVQLLRVYNWEVMVVLKHLLPNNHSQTLTTRHFSNLLLYCENFWVRWRQNGPYQPCKLQATSSSVDSSDPVPNPFRRFNVNNCLVALNNYLRASLVV